MSIPAVNARNAAAFEIGRHAVMHQLRDRGVVRYDQAVEAPSLSQQFAQQLAVRGARDARQVVEADHDRADAGIDRRLERRQHDVVHSIGAGINAVVVAPAFREAVAGKVLSGRHHRIRPRQIVLLVAFDHRRGKHGAEQRILSGAFGAASPARIARNVEHGRPRKRDSVGSRFDRGDARGAPDQRRIPGACETKGNRKYRTMPMDHIQCHDQRNSLRRIFDRDLLQLAKAR